MIIESAPNHSLQRTTPAPRSILPLANGIECIGERKAVIGYHISVRGGGSKRQAFTRLRCCRWTRAFAGGNRMPMWFKKKKERPILVAQDTFCPGNPGTLHGDSPSSQFSVVFEDDGETGYFYGLDTTLTDMRILDALHIYNVPDITDRDTPSLFQIVWAPDGVRAALFINNYPHAAFDFSEKRGYCRTNFPPPDPKFTKHSHEWSDDVLKYFG